MDKRHTEEDKYIVNKFNEYKEFIKDKQVSFVIRKTERIVYGVYMLSQFIPHTDSLYADLRSASSKLLEHVSLFVSTTTRAQDDINMVHARLQYLSSLLSLSYVSGYISSSNIEIMKSELNYLHKHIEELSTRSLSEMGQLHIKSDLFVVGQSKQPKPVEDTMSFIKPTVSFKKTKPVSVHSDSRVQDRPVQTAVSTVKTPVIHTVDRESRVLDVIRDKGVVSIKDISSVIFDVSEKTIQRTLNALIDKGQIKKEGERRWAKYQIT